MVPQCVSCTSSHPAAEYDFAIVQQIEDVRMIVAAVLMLTLMIAEALCVGRVMVRAELLADEVCTFNFKYEEPFTLAEML